MLSTKLARGMLRIPVVKTRSINISAFPRPGTTPSKASASATSFILSKTTMDKMTVAKKPVANASTGNTPVLAKMAAAVKINNLTAKIPRAQVPIGNFCNTLWMERNVSDYSYKQSRA